LIVVIGMREEVWPGGGWGFGNLRGSRKGVEKGMWPLCLGEEDTEHILLECPETKN
jgi:hypothetical protein